MTIQAIGPIQFRGQKKTDKGNDYQATKAGTAIGAATGAVIAAGLMYGQLHSLKSIRGRRNLIAGFHDRGISLNNIMKKVPTRDKEGKILAPEKGVTARTKKIVGGFKKTLALWGAGILAATTGAGKAVDTHINKTNAKRADEGAKKA